MLLKSSCAKKSRRWRTNDERVSKHAEFAIRTSGSCSVLSIASEQLLLIQQDFGHQTDNNRRLEIELASQQQTVKDTKEKLDATEKRANVAQDELSTPEFCVVH